MKIPKNISKFFISLHTPLPYILRIINQIMSSESMNEYQFGLLMKANDERMLQSLFSELDKIEQMEFKDIAELKSKYPPIYELAVNMEQKRNNYRNELLKKITIKQQ